MRKNRIGKQATALLLVAVLLLSLCSGGLLSALAELATDSAPNLVATGDLKPEYVSVPHEWNWSKAYPADYTYSSIVSMQGYASTGSLNWSSDGATAEGSKVGHLCHYKDKNSNGSDATVLNNEQALEAAKNYRFGLLYDLGGMYDLSSVSLYARPKAISNFKYYIHNYSVYAGVDKGNSLLTNCVARGGGAWDSTNNTAASTVDTTSTSFTANVTATESYRYVLIVFDRLGSDPYNTAWETEAQTGALAGAKAVNADAVGAVILTEVEIRGMKSANIVGKQNIIPEYVSVPHEWNWSKAYPADYTYSSVGSMQGYASTGSLNWSSDGATVEGSKVGHLCHYKDKNSNGSDATVLNNEQALEAAKNYRFGLLYDLGEAYQLSAVSLYARPKAISNFKYYIHNYSVYAGMDKGNSLLTNCVARGGGAWDSTNNAVASTVDTASTSFTANVTDTKSYRYVLIIFDRLGSDPYNTAWGTEAQTGALAGAKAVNADAVGAVILTEVEIYGKTKAAVNVAKEKALTPVVCDVKHNFNWSNAYPAGYTYSTLSTSAARQTHWGAVGLTDGKWGVTDETERQKTYEEFYLNDKSFSGTAAQKLAHNEEIAMANRLGLLFDLGGEYTLSQLVVHRSSRSEYIHNYSVYAGDTNSAALLQNCVARGGGAWDGTQALSNDRIDTTSMALSASVNTDRAYRYVLIVFDRMGTDPGNANYTSAYGHTIPASPDALPGSNVDYFANVGKVGLDEVEIFVQPAEADEGINVVAEKQLDDPATFSVPHSFSWSDAYPAKYTYTQMNAFNGNAYKNEKQNWCDGSTETKADLYYNSKTDRSDTPSARRSIEEQAMANRWAILYDLGATYALSRVNISIAAADLRAGQYIHNYSVYAGNTGDASLFGNLVARGGAAWDGTKALGKNEVNVLSGSYLATVSSDEVYRYVLIVFDRLGTDPGNANYGSLNGCQVPASAEALPGYAPDYFQNIGKLPISEIEIYGVKKAAEGGSNIVAEKNLTNPATYILPHTFSWSDAYPEKYTYTTMKAFNGNAYETEKKNWCDANASTAAQLYYTSTANKTDSAADRRSIEEQAMANRWGIVYDLGGYYDLSKVNLTITNSNLSQGRYIHNYSVYAGNSSGTALLSNLVGRGGAAWDGTKVLGADEANLLTGSYTAALSADKAYRYVLIVFDRLGSDPGNANWNKPNGCVVDRDPNALPGNNADYYLNIGLLNLAEIEIYGELVEEIKPNILKELFSKEQLEGEIYAIQHTFNPAADYTSVTYSEMNRTQKKLVSPKYKGEFNPEKWIDGNTGTGSAIHQPRLMSSKRWGLLYNLNGVYNLSEVDLTAMAGSDGEDYGLCNVSVYGGMDMNKLLQAESLLGRAGNGTAVSDLRVELDSTRGVQFVLFVFDRLGTDALLTGTESEGEAGSLGLNEIDLHGEKSQQEAVAVEKQENLLTKLQSEGTLQRYLYRIYQGFSWSDPYPEAYDYGLNADIYDITSERTYETEGVVDNDASSSGGDGNFYGGSGNWRWGLMFDLGDWYDLSDFSITMGKDSMLYGLYMYNYSVYGGASKDASIFANLLGRGGEAWDAENNRALTREETLARGHNVYFETKLNSQLGAVRYVFITFDRGGSDQGNLNANNSPDLEFGFPGYTVAPGGVWASDFALHGKKAANPTQSFSYTDAGTGVQVEVLTYDNRVPIHSAKVSLTRATEEEKENLLTISYEMGELFALNNRAYQITYYDANGKQITDLAGRVVRVNLPQQSDGILLYQIDDNGKMTEFVENIHTVGSIDGENYYFYVGAGDKKASRFIIASFDDYSLGQEDGEDEAGGDGDATGEKEFTEDDRQDSNFVDSTPGGSEGGDTQLPSDGDLKEEIFGDAEQPTGTAKKSPGLTVLAQGDWVLPLGIGLLATAGAAVVVFTGVLFLHIRKTKRK